MAIPLDGWASALVKPPKVLLDHDCFDRKAKLIFRSGSLMDDEQWLERRYYGGDLPADAERALHAVGLCWEDEKAAEALIREALSIAPDHIATNFGAFRFFYYRHRLSEAVPHVEVWLRETIRRNGFPEDWHAVTPQHADFTHFESEPRTFLFALRGLGIILTRLRRIDEGREMLMKVAELDPDDHMRAKRLLQTIDEYEEDDDKDQPAQQGAKA